ncbi:MAG: hypothetical protein JNN05_11570 [Candidatus Omnitrophica bacterium]|nr:hypothetical protein [Candidatus Omnitrophota bacterium]
MRRFCNLMFVVLCVLLSGCVSLSNVQNTPNARTLFKKKNSMVFGRAISQGLYVQLLVRNKQTKHSYEIAPPAQRAIFSKHKQDSMEQSYFSFLPPGEYKIFRILFGDGVRMGSVDTELTFTVAENSAVYLGSFIFAWEITKNYWLFEKGNIRYGVRDDSQEAIRRLWKRFPEFESEKLNVVVSLIRDCQRNPAPAESNSAQEVKK